jgi:hypothetical protein
MRISANRVIPPSCTIWIEFVDDDRAVAEVDSDGAIIWATLDQPCVGTGGELGFGPRLRRRQQSDDIVVYLPEEYNT